MSAQEEALLTAVRTSRHSLSRLKALHGELETAMEREAKQLERLQFAYEVSKRDAAYYKTLELLTQDAEDK